MFLKKTLCFILFSALLGLFIISNALFGHLRSTNTLSIEKAICTGFSPWISQSIWISKIENQEETPTNLRYYIRRVLNLAPTNRFYRINAARILAYDASLANQQTPITISQNIQTSLMILEEGVQTNPENAPFYNYEIGTLFLLKRNDPEAARRFFEKASTIKNQ